MVSNDGRHMSFSGKGAINKKLGGIGTVGGRRDIAYVGNHEETKKPHNMRAMPSQSSHGSLQRRP